MCFVPQLIAVSLAFLSLSEEPGGPDYSLAIAAHTLNALITRSLIYSQAPVSNVPAASCPYNTPSQAF